MRTALFNSTFGRDFPYLKYNLLSLEKFASGFSEYVILVPNPDLEELRRMVSELPGTSGIPIRCEGFDEWPGKGFLHHAAQIMRADQWCSNADFIAHWDSDCVFTAPVTPQTFIKDGKPILQFEDFDSIGKRHPGVLKWKEAAEACLPFAVKSECMRGHNETYGRRIYGIARFLIEQATGLSSDDYIKTCQNSFPQTFAEFPTLGAVAKELFPDQYHLVDNALKPNPDKSDFPVLQSWSHGAMDKPQTIWVEGVVKEIVPIEEFRKLGLC